MGPMKKKRRIPVFSPHNPARTTIFNVAFPIHPYGDAPSWECEAVWRVRALTEKQALRKAKRHIQSSWGTVYPWRKPYILETVSADD